ncbi:hypothetical protein MMC13_000260 [Lambiella insularis]|nr:hypothetical protein [Lambiella insularis]
MTAAISQTFGLFYDAAVVHLAATYLDWASPCKEDNKRSPADWVKKETDRLWWFTCDPKQFSVCNIVTELRTLDLGKDDYQPLEVENAISYWQRRELTVPEIRFGGAPNE